MNRRELLNRAAGLAAGMLASPLVRKLWGAAPVEPATSRTPVLAKYEELQFGVSFHFSMNTFTGNDYETGGVPASTYNPTRLDVRQWIRVARDLGAKYAVLTAKHMSGFCLWDSEGYDYDVAASKNKTDVVAAFMAACREYGLQPGLYYCILDPHNEGKFDWDSHVPDNYYQLIKHHLTELHTRYRTPFYPTARYHLEGFAGTALGVVPSDQIHEPGLHHSDEPSLLSEPPQSGTHLRNRELALRCDQRRRHAAGTRRPRSERKGRGRYSLHAHGGMDADWPSVQAHAADA